MINELFLLITSGWHNAQQQLLLSDWSGFSTTTATSFALIAAAELGDKSQLVCMSLAARHRPMPVLWGAITAFACLNALAVVFGSLIAHWLPDYVVASAVALLFTGFGVQALLPQRDEDDDSVSDKSGHSIFWSTFVLLTVAEFGDKTQLAVVGLSSTQSSLAVWLGATLGLGLLSALGIVAGRTVLQRLPLALLHRISGLFFLVLGAIAAVTAWNSAFPS